MPRPGFTDHLHGFFAFVSAPGGDDYPCPFAGEKETHTPSDA
jgi:hypothetical protein